MNKINLLKLHFYYVELKWHFLLSGEKNVVGGTYAKSALVDKFSEKKTKTCYRKSKISGDFS